MFKLLTLSLSSVVIKRVPVHRSFNRSGWRNDLLFQMIWVVMDSLSLLSSSRDSLCFNHSSPHLPSLRLSSSKTKRLIDVRWENSGLLSGPWTEVFCLPFIVFKPPNIIWDHSFRIETFSSVPLRPLCLTSQKVKSRKSLLGNWRVTLCWDPGP